MNQTVLNQLNELVFSQALFYLSPVLFLFVVFSFFDKLVDLLYSATNLIKSRS